MTKENKNYVKLIGKVYEDPEGEWEIIGVSGNLVDVKCVQEGNINEGKTLSVPIDEAIYYLEGGK